MRRRGPGRIDGRGAPAGQYVRLVSGDVRAPQGIRWASAMPAVAQCHALLAQCHARSGPVPCPQWPMQVRLVGGDVHAPQSIRWAARSSNGSVLQVGRPVGWCVHEC